MNYRKWIAFSMAAIIAGPAMAQKIDQKKWYQLDPTSDSVYGISLDKAYNFLKGKTSTPIIVAVIDAGIDTTHEDLKQITWNNPKEIPGNNIDDDHNGYIDDIHGWNFLGNPNGKNVNKETEEKYRIYYLFKDRYLNKEIDTTKLSFKEKYEYRSWLQSKNEIMDPDKSSQDAQMSTFLTMTYNALSKADTTLQSAMDKKVYTLDELEKYTPSTDAAIKAKYAMLAIRRIANFSGETPNTEIISGIESERDKYNNAQAGREKAPKPYRQEIVQDNYYNFKDSIYGNADVYAADPMHGTHVSGIIAAVRNNNIGIDGIADNVKIMAIRAVPDGDEYDKDIARAIHYAVDNGAKVINMSFGKGYSPEKYWVDSAFDYAAKHDVLLVHAAGNESSDNDSVQVYPNGDLIFLNKKSENLITVGASGDTHIDDKNLAASFSNYGKNTVDVFAPGVKIYSTLPQLNKYGYESGTSMATPVVVGVAALIRSYYPKLSAEQVKYAIEQSVVKPNQFTKLPGGDTSVPFEDLSKTGGIVNAYNALQVADTLTPAKPSVGSSQKKSKK